MQLSRTSATLILAYISLVTAAPAAVGNDSASKNLVFTPTEANEINALVSGLNEYNAAHKVTGYEKRELLLDDATRELIARSKLPILDEILAALKNSGLANVVIDFVLLNPELLDITAEATIFILKSALFNLTDVLIALEKSGSVIQILNLALDDPEILPGLLRIGKELLKQNGLNIYKRSDGLSDDLSYSFDTSEIVESSVFDVNSLDKRESELLNELFTSLKDSGLLVSIVQHLLTTPDLAEPAATFLTKIIKSHAITLKELLDALKESHFIFNILKQILHDKELLKKFADMIFERISKGIIPKDMYEKA